MTTPAIDFDSPWKEALGEYLADALALFFPPIHAQIDWSRPPEFLEAELQQVMRDAVIGRQVADKLVRVWLLSGEDVWLVLHVEVQSQEEGRFPERMYIYNYRIFDQFRRDVVSLAILGDERATWRPTQYLRTRWGCRVQFTFPMVKLADYRGRRAALEGRANPFATVVLAHLAAQDTRGDMSGRAQAKLALTRRLYERGEGRERIVSLYRFIDWLLELPPGAEAQLQQAIRQLEEERQMPYITSIERMGRAEGRQEGRQEGRVEGEAVGRAEGTRAALRRLVRARFGGVPAALEARLAAADQEALDHVLDRVVIVQRVEDL